MKNKTQKKRNDISSNSGSSNEEEILDRIGSDEEYDFNPKLKEETADQKKDMDYWDKLEIDLESSRKSFYQPPKVTSKSG